MKTSINSEKSPPKPRNRSLVQKLQEQIRQVETANRIVDENLVSSGCAAVNELLPGAGYSRGTLVQWISSEGNGADFLSLLVAKKACEDGGALVVVDSQQQFFPPAAAALGINLDNLIVLRTSQSSGSSFSGTQTTAQENDLLWAIDQSLRCPAVAAVWGPMDEIDERWFRRFQLSAESSGCLGLFVQPLIAAKRPSWAEVQWIVDSKPQRKRRRRTPLNSGLPLPEIPNEQTVHLELTRCRGTHCGKKVNVSINHITGNVQMARSDYEPGYESTTWQTTRSDKPLSANHLPVAS